MNIGDLVSRVPASLVCTGDVCNKVGVVIGITTIEDLSIMILIGYEIEWSDGKTTTETGFNIRKLHLIS